MIKPLTVLCLLFLSRTARAADYKFPIGEEAVYKIKWGLITCGQMQINCDEVTVAGKELVRIRTQANSSRLLSTVYPVNDTVDCYIDPETQLSVRLEKHTVEGGFVCQDLLELDRTVNRAQWTSRSANISTNYPIAPEACDAVSFLYTMRMVDFTETPQHQFDIVVDHAVQGLIISAGKTDIKTITDDEKVLCRQFTVAPKRDDLFVRKIPKEIWITEDDRRILARMTIITPRGKARIVLNQYRPPFK